MTANHESANTRAKSAEAWFKSIAAEQFGDQWLPLSIREHFGTDWPHLLRVVAQLRTEEAKWRAEAKQTWHELGMASDEIAQLRAELIKAKTL